MWVCFVFALVALSVFPVQGSTLLSSSSRRYLDESALGCDLCSFVFSEAMILLNTTNTSVLVGDLSYVCGRLFNNGTKGDTACLELAAAAAKSLEKFSAISQWNSSYPPKVICALLLDGLCKLPCCQDNTPQQTYVTFGTPVNSSMRASWVTLSGTVSMVRWGASPTSMINTAKGVVDTYTDAGWVGTLHHAPLNGLVPGSTYFYQVTGDGTTWSSATPFVFPAQTYPFRVAMVADMGWGNYSQGTQDMLSALVDNQTITWMQHIGDVAYADGNQIIWDEYGRQRSKWSSRTPYVLVPGNHEIPFNFAAYRHRYPMSMSPGPMGTNLYWSFDYAGVHFVGVNAESPIDTPLVDNEQLAWLASDLASAKARKQARSLDWIVVSVHRPLYCSSWMARECIKFAAYLRGLLEDIFQNNLVDVVFQGHAHNYERSTPVYNQTVMPAGAAPVYVVNGIGGCREGNVGGFHTPGPAWRVVGINGLPGNPAHNMFGFGILSVNATSLHYQIFSDDTGIFDEFTLSPRR